MSTRSVRMFYDIMKCTSVELRAPSESLICKAPLERCQISMPRFALHLQGCGQIRQLVGVLQLERAVVQASSHTQQSSAAQLLRNPAFHLWVLTHQIPDSRITSHRT